MTWLATAVKVQAPPVTAQATRAITAAITAATTEAEAATETPEAIAAAMGAAEEATGEGAVVMAEVVATGAEEADSEGTGIEMPAYS